MTRLSIIFWLACFLAAAQTNKPGQFSTEKEIETLVPTSATDLVTQTVYVTELTLTNEAAGSGNDAVCTITSKTSGRKLFADSIYGTGQNKSSHYVFPYRARMMPGGISWSCTTANVTAYISYRY